MLYHMHALHKRPVSSTPHSLLPSFVLSPVEPILTVFSSLSSLYLASAPHPLALAPAPSFVPSRSSRFPSPSVRIYYRPSSHTVCCWASHSFFPFWNIPPSFSILSLSLFWPLLLSSLSYGIPSLSPSLTSFAFSRYLVLLSSSIFILSSITGVSLSPFPLLHSPPVNSLCVPLVQSSTHRTAAPFAHAKTSILSRRPASNSQVCGNTLLSLRVTTQTPQ